MLPSVKSGFAASFSIVFEDGAGAAIPATAATWRLLDDRGVQIATGSATGFTSGDTSAVIDIAAINIVTTNSRAGRELIVIASTAGGPLEFREVFVILSPVPLIVPENSFQTYTEAVATRLGFGQQFSGWDSEDDDGARISALEQAYERLVTFTYRVRDHLSGAPSSYAGYGLGASISTRSLYRVRLQGITLEMFDALSPRFLKSLKRAQLIEADSILDGDTTFSKRAAGITSEKIGESAATFSQTASLDTGLSKAAYSEISRYLDLQVRIARCG